MVNILRKIARGTNIMRKVEASVLPNNLLRKTIHTVQKVAPQVQGYAKIGEGVGMAMSGAGALSGNPVLAASGGAVYAGSKILGGTAKASRYGANIADQNRKADLHANRIQRQKKDSAIRYSSTNPIFEG